MSASDRRALIDRDAPSPSIRRQCALLGVARSRVYRPPRPANDNDLALMRRIDDLYTAWPFLGSRRMAALRRAEGQRINRKRVQRLMRQMGIAALGPKPRTTKPAPGHKIFPYLLRELVIERPNHVWAADITYVPIGRGFLYMVAIIETGGSQFTSGDFTGMLAGAGIRISMDGRGRWIATGRAVRCWLGGCRTRWMSGSALRRWRRRSPGSASRKSSTPTRACPGEGRGQPIHQRGLHRHAGGGRHPPLDGRAEPLDRQRVHRAAVAQPEIRGHLPQRLRRRPRGQSRDRRMAGLL